MASGAIWDTFEHISCINLVERDDRYQKAMLQFENVGLSDKVRFHRPNKSIFGGIHGCAESHFNVIKNYYENQSIQFAIVFEDDVVFNKGWETVVQDVIDFIRKKDLDEWDVILLGSIMLYPIEKSSLFPNKIWNAKCILAHAYVISRTGMQKFLNGIKLD
eukprot:344025_1